MVDFSPKSSFVKNILSLKILVPGSVFIVFLTIMAVTLFMSLWQGTEELQKQSQLFVQREVIRLSHLAEGTIHLEPQLLEDSITHLSTNPMVKNIAVLKPSNIILYSNNFSWRGESAAQVLPNGTLEYIHQAKQSRLAIIRYDENKKYFTAIISFTYPKSNTELRSLNRGTVYLRYDISKSLSQSYLTAIHERIPETISMLLLALLLAELLRRYVVAPLKSIKSATECISCGDFNSSLKPVGPIEIQALTNKFNEMNSRLSETVTALDLKTVQTQGILDNTFDGIITINKTGTIMSFNKTAESIFEIAADEVIGKNVKSLMPEPYKTEHDRYIHNYTSTGITRIIGIGREVQGRRADGSIFPMDLAVTEIKSKGESLFIGIVRDITERKEKEMEVIKTQEKLAQANKKLQEMVGTDGLTGVANRRKFDEIIQVEFKRATRQGHSLSLLMFDVDFFKKYNDHYGHIEGDQCLIQVAQTAKQLFQRNGELVARYGGEEFAVIIPHSDIKHATKSAHILLERIHNLNIPHTKSSISNHVTISVGVTSTIPTQQYDVKDLITITDSALYRAKENGRAQVVAFPAVQHKTNRKITANR